MINKNLKILDWDTNFFGFKIAQFNEKKLNKKNLQYAFKFCKKYKVRLLQFKCEVGDNDSILLAEANNFHLADIRLIFKKKIEPIKNLNTSLSKNFKFRVAKVEDKYVLKKIVCNLYVNSRFYNDKNFSKTTVKDFYKAWIENSVHGKFDDLVYIICNEDLPIGFCSLKFISSKIVKIGLFGVDKTQLGKGVGSELLKNVLFFLSKKKIRDISVTTQGTNYHAQRLYQKLGFQIEKFEILYHCWL